MNKLGNATVRSSIVLTLLIVTSIVYNPCRAEEIQPGNRYKVVRSVYLRAAYNSLNNKQLSRETARAYLSRQQLLAKRVWMAFQSEVPVGTIMTIIGPAPKIWHLPFLASRYFVRLDPDVSRGLDVELELDRGFEGGLDGLNPALFSRLE